MICELHRCVVQHMINIIDGHSLLALMHTLLAEKRDYIKK